MEKALNDDDDPFHGFHVKEDLMASFKDYTEIMKEMFHKKYGMKNGRRANRY